MNFFIGIVVLLGFIVFICGVGIITWCDRKSSEENNDFITFYFGRRLYRGKTERIKKLDWNYILSHWMFFILTFLVAFLIVLLSDWNILYGYIHNHVQFSLEVMVNSCISMILSLSIIKEWNKSSYLAFSIDDILRSYQVPETMFNLILIMFVSLISWMLPPMSEKNGINMEGLLAEFLIISIFVFYLYEFGRMVWIIFNTMLGTKTEEKMLNSLYRDLWYKKRKKVYGKWSKEGIEDNIDYLAEQYKRSCKKLYITKIEFDTNLNRGMEPRYKKVRIKSAQKISLITFICLFIAILYLTMCQIWSAPISMKIIASAISSAILSTAIYILGRKTFFGEAYAILCYERSSYYLEVAKYKKSKIKFIPEAAISLPNKYIRYIRALKNLIAYFGIALENDKKVKSVFKTVEEEYKNDKNFDIVIMIMDYFYFRKKKKHIVQLNIKNISAIKQDIAKAIIRDIERTIKDGKLSDDGFEMYIKDISKS